MLTACTAPATASASTSGQYCELDLPPEAIGTEFLSPENEVGETLCLRCTLCPGYGTVLDSQVCRPADELSDDVRLLN